MNEAQHGYRILLASPRDLIQRVGLSPSINTAFANAGGMGLTPGLGRSTANSMCSARLASSEIFTLTQTDRLREPLAAAGLPICSPQPPSSQLVRVVGP